MFNFAKCFIALSASLLLGYAPLTLGDANTQKKLAAELEKSLAAEVSSQDHVAASNTALRLAYARRGLGQTAAACTALAQSLEHYRKAVVKETGVSEAETSSLNDGSDGMAKVRAKFGCPRN